MVSTQYHCRWVHLFKLMQILCNQKGYRLFIALLKPRFSYILWVNLILRWYFSQVFQRQLCARSAAPQRVSGFFFFNFWHLLPGACGATPVTEDGNYPPAHLRGLHTKDAPAGAVAASSCMITRTIKQPTTCAQPTTRRRAVAPLERFVEASKRNPVRGCNGIRRRSHAPARAQADQLHDGRGGWGGVTTDCLCKLWCHAICERRAFRAALCLRGNHAAARFFPFYSF